MKLLFIAGIISGLFNATVVVLVVLLAVTT